VEKDSVALNDTIEEESKKEIILSSPSISKKVDHEAMATVLD